MGGGKMARFITVKRKYLVYCGIVLAIAVLGYLGFNFAGAAQSSLNPDTVQPEMKIISIEFDPQIQIRNQTYGEEEFKGIQIMPKTNFKISAIIQNMTEQTVNDIPVRLTISSLTDKSQQISKKGEIPSLEPGATAKISFENIKALGDAKGKSATAGQHEMVLAISANPESGLNQSTEARVIFNVDSAAK